MARFQFIPSAHRGVALCACAAAVLLAAATGCDSSCSATRSKSTGAGSDVAAQSAAAPEKTAANDPPAVSRADEETASAESEPTAHRSGIATDMGGGGGPADPAAGGVNISGRIAYKGTPPPRRPINMSKDAKCIEAHEGKQVLDEDLLVATGGGIKNAFVRIGRGAPKAEYPMPEKPAELNQQGCMFRPRVQGVRVGQKLLVGNADPVTHNVRSFPVFNQPFNFGQPAGTDPRERVFQKAEREIEVQCDFHQWMHAYIFVMDHPFFDVSADDGTYAISGLPPGEYALETWHEKLGKQKKTITVADRDLADVDFTYPTK